MALCAVLPAAGLTQQASFDVLDGRGALMGWEAVGRLDNGRGFCTGTLISRDIVLTAAHCVHDTRGNPMPAASMLFRSGYHRGDAIAERRVVDWVSAPEYADAEALSGLAVAHDIALLKLGRHIVPSEAAPFGIVSAPPNGTRVSVLSYGQGREHVLSREAECALTGQYQYGVLGFDCDVTFGSSGAPVFVREDGRLRILSVISALGKTEDGRKTAYGMTLPNQVSALSARLGGSAGAPTASEGARRISVGQRNQTGARFVRPGG